MMAKPMEIIQSSKRAVACDGGDGPLGHPRVYLTIGAENEILCPYCSRLYQFRVSTVGDAAD
jgi:uncharacterized Zn-finger protein